MTSMPCGSVRELLFAFLDNELEAQANIAVQLHLEHCAACAREAEIERTVRRQLVAALDRGNASDLADARAFLSQVSPPRSKRSRRFARTTRLVMLSGALAAGIAIWLGVGRDHASAPPRARWPFSAAGLVADFEHFLDVGRPLHLTVGDPRVLAQWMQQEFARAIEVPLMHGQCKLVGARRCDAFADTAALALYEIDGGPAALVVTHAPSDLDEGSCVEHLRGHTILIHRRGDLAYAAVGRQNEPALRELLPRR